MKSEPSTFSIDDLKQRVREPWDGIRNYQVRNMIRDTMKRGDLALFYHSSCEEIGVVGEMEIVSAPYPDPLQFDTASNYYDQRSKKEAPLWYCVDVRFKKKYSKTITISTLKNILALESSPIVQRGNRLSIVQLQKMQYEAIVDCQK